MIGRLHPAVKAIIQQGDKFLVIKQRVNDLLVVWDLPGGKVDYKESPYETLYREVKEETRLDVDIIKPVGLWWFFRQSDGDQVVCTTFVCTPKSSDVDLTKNPDDEHIEEYRWVTKDEFLSDEYKVSHQSLKELISSCL